MRLYIIPKAGSRYLICREEQTKEKDVDLTLSENVPTRKGYRFIEWNTKEDGSGTSYDPGATYSKNQVVTLYAIWYRYYEEGLFGAKLSKDQILDVITSTNMINGYGYDASWGTQKIFTKEARQHLLQFFVHVCFICLVIVVTLSGTNF